MGWLMTGQLIKIIICDGTEQRFVESASDTNTETEHFSTTEDDEEKETEVTVGRNGAGSKLVQLL